MTSFAVVKKGRSLAGRIAWLAAGSALCAAIGLVSPALGAAAPTGPTTFGQTSLAQAPDVAFGCDVIPYQFSGPAPGGPSCTWGSPLFDIGNAAAGGLDVPATGTVYQVKLRVGATTGPMQLVVLRTFFDPNDIVNNQCCRAEALSSVFTPVANGITTLNVDLPVSEGEESTATGPIDVLDQIGLSVLETGVPIPVINDTSQGVDGEPVDDYMEPAMTLGETHLAADPDGYALDMQATWYPPGQSPATVVIPAQTVRVTGTNALVGVDCSLAPCAGTVTVTGQPIAKKAAATAARKAKPVTYASGSFNLGAGASASVPAKLSSQGRALARKHTRTKVTITVKLTNVTPAKTITRTMTVRF